MPRLLLLALAVSACAQTPTDKPAAVPAERGRRADSVVTRADERVADRPEEDLGGGVVVERRDAAAGETPVGLLVHLHPREGRFAFQALNLHDNEDTSVEAALAVAARTGGRVVALSHTGARNLTFEAGGRRYVADPNRMFTDAGRRRTLAALSAADPAALAALADFASAVLAAYAEAEPAVVVTLHNNTEGRYSAASYAPGAEYAADAAAVALQPGVDPDDFFFVTDRALYDALVARGFNVVLQDNDAASDDGSLSVWAAREGMPYVNVEAQHGHVAEQTRMIEALVEILAGR